MELKDISRVGLGGCELPEDQEKANALIDYAISRGINFFDQGWGYGGAEHKSEKILGNYLEKNPKVRDNILICDKFPMIEEIFNKFGGNNEEAFNKMFEEQLSVLKTNYIDVYMLHALDDNKYMNEKLYCEIIEWMLKLKQEGKIKHIGFSAHIDLYKLNYYLDLFSEKFGKEVDVAMLTYNIFSGSDWVTRETGINVWPNPGAKGFELCKKKGYTTISMMPLESGRALEVSHDKTFTDWCYKYIADNTFIDSTLSGTSRIEHLDQVLENIKPVVTYKKLKEKKEKEAK